MVIQSGALGPPSGLVKSFLCLVTLGRKSPAAVWQRPVPVWSGTRGSCAAWFVHLSETEDSFSATLHYGSNTVSKTLSRTQKVSKPLVFE